MSRANQSVYSCIYVTTLRDQSYNSYSFVVFAQAIPCTYSYVSQWRYRCGLVRLYKQGQVHTSNKTILYAEAMAINMYVC